MQQHYFVYMDNLNIWYFCKFQDFGSIFRKSAQWWYMEVLNLVLRLVEDIGILVVPVMLPQSSAKMRVIEVCFIENPLTMSKAKNTTNLIISRQQLKIKWREFVEKRRCQKTSFTVIALLYSIVLFAFDFLIA